MRKGPEKATKEETVTISEVRSGGLWGDPRILLWTRTDDDRGILLLLTPDLARKAVKGLSNALLRSERMKSRLSKRKRAAIKT